MARKKILIVDDEKLIRWSLRQKFSEWNFDCIEAENGKQAIAKLQNTIKHALETASLKKEIAYYKEKEKKQFDPSQIVASSKVMNQVLDMVKKVAQSEASIILLQGDSGTGKDLLAQAIHHLSRRNQYAFVAINCSAIPENLLESELFGYEKGAFTDAKHQKKGLVELADRGTLFLDEISTLNIHLQAKLLRFLETQIFKRVGGLKDIEVDIRVITATNQDLEIAAQEGKFRRDLLYRLNVCPIFIPSLYERKEDIIPLAQHFISEQNIKFRKNIKGLKAEAKKLFLDYDWPGNVRELKNAIERAMIFEEGPSITTNYLPIHFNSDSPLSRLSTKKVSDKNLSLQEMEKNLLLKALNKANGNKTKAAKLLKITRDTLRYKIKKYEIKTEEFAGL